MGDYCLLAVYAGHFWIYTGYLGMGSIKGGCILYRPASETGSKSRKKNKKPNRTEAKKGLNVRLERIRQKVPNRAGLMFYKSSMRISEYK